MLETAAKVAARLPRAMLALVDWAFASRRAWRGHRLSGDTLAEQGLLLRCELERFATGQFAHPPNRWLARLLQKHALNWFRFLVEPTIEATNHWAELAIRLPVVNRKVWGGNHTGRELGHRKS